MVQLVSVGKLMGAQPPAGPRVAPSDFPTVFDATYTPPFQYDDVNQYYRFNGQTYTSRAAYVAAGGATQGTGFIPLASLGSPPYTVQFTGILPATINASRETCLMFRGSTSGNFASVRLDPASSGTAQYRITTAGAAQMGGSGITQPLGTLGIPWQMSFTVAAAPLSTDRTCFISANGRTPANNTGAVSLSTLSTGLYIGWDPDNPSSFFRGTVTGVTVWSGQLGPSACRAIGTANTYGPSRVTLSATGGGQSLNVGTYTYMGLVTNGGDEVQIKIRNDNRQMVGIRTLSTSPGVEDDHNRPDMILTSGGGMICAWTNHDVTQGFWYATCADTNFDNMSGSSFVSTPGLILAYGTLLLQESTGTVFFACRSNQCYWNLYSWNGTSWTSMGRFIDNSATGDKTLAYFSWLDADTVRVFFQGEPQTTTGIVKVLDMNVTTGALTSGAGNVGTIGVANGAVFGSCSTIWNPGAGFSSFCQLPASPTAFQGGVLDNTLNTQQYYWVTGNPATPYAPWTPNFVVDTGLGTGVTNKWKGGCCIINVPGLSVPWLCVSRLDSGDNKFHIETWKAANASGSGTWVAQQVIAIGGDNVNQLWGRPSSADNADPNLPFTYLFGYYQDFDDYQQQITWPLTPPLLT